MASVRDMREDVGEESVGNEQAVVLGA